MESPSSSRARRIGGWVLRRLRSLAIIYVIYVLAGCGMLRSVIFPRHMTETIPTAGEEIRGLERWTIDSPDGPVEAWFVRGDGVSAQQPGPAVIFAHGNAELIDYQQPMISGYRRMGISTLVIEYRGYGRSAGSPSQENITADFAAGYDKLVTRPDVDRGRIIYHGRSIGTGVVCALAEQRAPAAMILTSPMTSITDMARRYLVPGFVIRDKFDNMAAVRAGTWPLLIMHGSHDEIIPCSHGRALAEAARDRATMLEMSCGHNDVPITSQEFWGAIATFLRQRGVLKA